MPSYRTIFCAYTRSADDCSLVLRLFRCTGLRHDSAAGLMQPRADCRADSLFRTREPTPPHLMAKKSIKLFII